jgi:hypothetical protein
MTGRSLALADERQQHVAAALAAAHPQEAVPKDAALKPSV